MSAIQISRCHPNSWYFGLVSLSTICVARASNCSLKVTLCRGLAEYPKKFKSRMCYGRVFLTPGASNTIVPSKYCVVILHTHGPIVNYVYMYISRYFLLFSSLSLESYELYSRSESLPDSTCSSANLCSLLVVTGWWCHLPGSCAAIEVLHIPPFMSFHTHLSLPT